MRRSRRLVVAALALGVIAVGWGMYIREPDLSGLDPGDVRAVEVRFEPFGEDLSVAPGFGSADPDAIAALVAVLRAGTETADHKCGSRGIVTLRRSLGRSVALRFLPGHHAEWYEVRYAGKVYRVPRAEFVAAMRRVGGDVPRECH